MHSGFLNIEKIRREIFKLQLIAITLFLIACFVSCNSGEASSANLHNNDIVSDRQRENSAKQLLFISNKDGGENFYSVNADGTDSRKITRNRNVSIITDYEIDPVIITAYLDDSPITNIYRLHENGLLDPLSDNTTHHVVFNMSPDRKKIAYYDGKPNIYVMNIDGSSKMGFEGKTGDYPFWSPDSKYIAKPSLWCFFQILMPISILLLQSFQ
jgi:hypothetical protein